MIRKKGNAQAAVEPFKQGEIPPHALQVAQAVTRVLETAVGIPGTKVRIGLDALLGLIPGVGDVAGAGLAAYIILLSAKMGAPASMVVRMLANVGIDSIIGLVPLAGDIFDIGWKANSRNLGLLTQFIEEPKAVKRSSRMIIAAVILGLSLIGAIGLMLTVLTFRLLFG